MTLESAKSTNVSEKFNRESTALRAEIAKMRSHAKAKIRLHATAVYGFLEHLDADRMEKAEAGILRAEAVLSVSLFLVKKNAIAAGIKTPLA